MDPKNHWNNIPSARLNHNNKAIDEAFQNEGVGKLLDSNGFEIEDGEKFDNQFYNGLQIFNQNIHNPQSNNQVQQDIMPEYVDS